MHNRKLPEGDYEGDMAKAQLQKIEKYAKHLNEMIHPEDELEAWVQAKLSVIAAYIGDIKHYLEYELQESGEMGEEFRYGGGVSGVAEEIQLYYVTDDEGDVKKIFDNYQDASYFLKRTLKGRGDVREAIVDEDDWENEKITTYNIKNFGDGGMVMQKRQAERILGKEKWSKLSDKEKIKATKYLIAKGQIEEYEKAVRGKKIKDKYSYSEYRFPPSTRQEDMKEAEELLGEEKWNSFTDEEKIKVTQYLKAQGRIGYFGMEEDLETLSGMQYYSDGGQVWTMGEYQTIKDWKSVVKPDGTRKTEDAEGYPIRKNGINVYLVKTKKEAIERVKRLNSKMADGGMADGGMMNEWKVTFVNIDSGEEEIVSVWANSRENAISIAKDETGYSNMWQVVQVKIQMAKGGMTKMADGGEIRKIKGYNFSEQIENGRKFKELIQRVYDSQVDYKYPMEFISAIARGKNPIVKSDGKLYVKGYMYKGTLSHFEFLEDPNFIAALQYVDRPAIRKFGEGGEVEELEIEFEKEGNQTKVEYSIKINGNEYEISGKIVPYNTGRSEEYEFEPDYFEDKESERYYNDNWEKIEEQIINAYHKN